MYISTNLCGGDQKLHVVKTHCDKLTVTGESTDCTFPSSIRISRALRHSLLTCSSEIGSQRISCEICLDLFHEYMFGFVGHENKRNLADAVMGPVLVNKIALTLTYPGR